MKQFVVLNSITNEVAYTFAVASSEGYFDGKVIDESTICFEMPEDVDVNDVEALSTLYIGASGTLSRRERRPSHFYKWVNDAWVLNIELIAGEKSREISNSCKASIIAGYASNALGDSYFYPCNITDQQNLNGAVISSLLDGGETWSVQYWCADSAGVWSFRNHSVANIQQVARDCKAHILQQMSKNEVLQAQIAQATTLEEINLIKW